MSIRDEFEKAFEKEFGIPGYTGDNDIAPALWAAQWMANKCADIAGNGHDLSYDEIQREILDLELELYNPKQEEK